VYSDHSENECQQLRFLIGNVTADFVHACVSVAATAVVDKSLTEVDGEPEAQTACTKLWACRRSMEQMDLSKCGMPGFSSGWLAYWLARTEPQGRLPIQSKELH
jgi:hypothetical protein